MTRAELWARFYCAVVSSGKDARLNGEAASPGEFADAMLEEFQKRFPDFGFSPGESVCSDPTSPQHEYNGWRDFSTPNGDPTQMRRCLRCNHFQSRLMFPEKKR